MCQPGAKGGSRQSLYQGIFTHVPGNQPDHSPCQSVNFHNKEDGSEKASIRDLLFAWMSCTEIFLYRTTQERITVEEKQQNHQENLTVWFLS